MSLLGCKELIEIFESLDEYELSILSEARVGRSEALEFPEGNKDSLWFESNEESMMDLMSVISKGTKRSEFLRHSIKIFLKVRRGFEVPEFMNAFSANLSVEFSIDDSNVDKVGSCEYHVELTHNRVIETKFVKINFADGAKTKIFVLVIS